MNTLKFVAIVGLGLTLSGCFESRKNTEQLCESNPALRCDSLNVDDGQCRLPRTDLIWHRLEVIKDPSEQNKITEYHILTEYEKCLTLAAQIQPLTVSERKSKRVTTVMHVQQEQQRIVKELGHSSHPHALYFLWSQVGDENAKRSFLQLEGSPALDTAEMQYALATFYTDRDANKTLQLLNRSLELSDGKSVNVSAIESLASINLQLNRREMAYIWSQVAAEFNVQTASKKNHNLLYGFTEDKYAQLDDIADDVYDAIDDGKYRTGMIPSL